MSDGMLPDASVHHGFETRCLRTGAGYKKKGLRRECRGLQIAARGSVPVGSGTGQETWGEGCASVDGSVTLSFII